MAFDIAVSAGLPCVSSQHWSLDPKPGSSLSISGSETSYCVKQAVCTKCVSNPVFPRTPLRLQHVLLVPPKQKLSHCGCCHTKGGPEEWWWYRWTCKAREMDPAEVGGWQCQNVIGSSSFWGTLRLLNHTSPSHLKAALHPSSLFLWDRSLAVIQSSKGLGAILCLILGF